MTEGKPVVVFDFDRTITSTDTIKFCIVSLLVLSPLRLFGALAFILRYGPKGLFLSEHKHRLIGYLVKNRSVASVNKSLGLFNWIVQKCIRHDIKSAMNKHMSQNAFVVIATASPGFAVSVVFKDQPVTIIGTTYEIADGKYTGTVSSPICIGEEKLDRVQKALIEKGLDGIDIAYSDHFSDLPLLRYAKKAVFVYPDSKTKEHCTSANDEILS